FPLHDALPISEPQTNPHQDEPARCAWRYRYGLLAAPAMTPIPRSGRSWSGGEALGSRRSALRHLLPGQSCGLHPGPAAPVTAVKAAAPTTDESKGIPACAGSAGLAAVLLGRRPGRPNPYLPAPWSSRSMGPVVSLVIADPQQLLADGLAILLDAEDDFAVLGVAHDGPGALELTAAHQPAALLLGAPLLGSALAPTPTA